MSHRALTQLFGFACSWILIAGCGAAEHASVESAAEAEVAADASGTAFRAPASAPSETPATADIKPKIIYTANVRLVADDFSRAAEELDSLVEEVKGYVASANQDRASGQSRSGSWTIRVPVTAFERFLGSLDAIGFVESRDQRSEDVTMEYVDVEARIANLKRLEERFVALLAEKTGKLEDILTVEQELARVRGDIEQAQGRLRFLTNKTDFSTVTVAVREEKDYVPPQAPSFGEQIATTWSQSLGALRKAGEALVLLAVAVLPWLVVAAVPITLLIVLIRSISRRKAIGSAR